jgi:hypothetical protein
MSRQKNFPIPQFDLRDIYSSQQLHDVMLVARDRVFYAFDHATENQGGKTRGTMGYIAGAGVRQRELAAHIIRHRMKPFISLATLPSLPPQLVDLPNRHAYSELIREIHNRVLRLAIEGLAREHIIWHDGCVWNLLPAAQEAYREKTAASTKVIKKARRVRV